MNKKNKNILIGIFVILGIVLVLGLSNILPFALPLTGAPLYECQGGIDATITKIERTPGQSTFKVIATANRAGDCLKIAWTSEDVNYYLKQSSPEEIADRGVYADIILNSQTETFKTIPDRDYSGSVRYVKNHLRSASLGTFISCSVDNIKRKAESGELDSSLKSTVYALRDIGGFGFPCYAIYTTNKGYFAPFSGIQSRGGSASLYVTGATPQILNYGTREDGSFFGGGVSIPGKIENVLWQGDLLGSKFIGTPSGYKGFLIGNNYIMVDGNLGYIELSPSEMDVSTTDGSFTSLEECLGKFSNWEIRGTTRVDRCINAYNNKASQFLIDRLNDYKSSDSDVKSASFSGSNLVVGVNPYSTSFPQFTMTVNAAWVGVHYVLGRPQVSCPSDFNMQSGDRKIVPLTVKNIDTKENGAFGLSLICGSFNAAVSPLRVTLFPGESTDVSGDITASVISQTTETCTFKATTVKTSDRTSQCTFRVTTVPNQFCIPNIEKKCSDDRKSIGVCNAQGTDFVYTLCENGCEYKDGSAKCIGQICKKEGETAVSAAECCTGLEFNKDTKKCEKPSGGTCNTCDDYVMNQVFGKVFDKTKCTPKAGTYTGAIIFKLINLIVPGEPLDDSFPQNATTCAISYFKFGMSVMVLLFGTLIMGNIFNKKKLIKNKAVGFLVGFVISGVIAYLTFKFFIIGLIYLLGIIIYSTTEK